MGRNSKMIKLFLNETIPKNLTSCFKHPPFLDFFFSRLRPNATHPDLFDQGYKYVSPCGKKELNFVKTEDGIF
jgi:hypothetical protein